MNIYRKAIFFYTNFLRSNVTQVAQKSYYTSLSIQHTTSE